MTDIVEILRFHANSSNYPATMYEAADEITRLRAALEEIADWKKHGWIAGISDIARAALAEEKQDE